VAAVAAETSATERGGSQTRRKQAWRRGAEAGVAAAAGKEGCRSLGGGGSRPGGRAPGEGSRRGLGTRGWLLANLY
jgi:hypothetical protein